MKVLPPLQYLPQLKRETDLRLRNKIGFVCGKNYFRNSRSVLVNSDMKEAPMEIGEEDSVAQQIGNHQMCPRLNDLKEINAQRID